MATITFNFGGNNVTPAPFILIWDFLVSWSGDENYPSYSYPSHDGYFTNYTQQGEIIDVKPLLKEQWQEYHDTAIAPVSETFTCLEYDENSTTKTITYDLYYNPSQPNILRFTPTTQGGYAVTPVDLNYGVDQETDAEILEHSFCITLTKMHNMPNMQYNGEYIVNMMMFRPSFNYRTVDHSTVYPPPTYLPQDYLTAVYQPESLFNIMPVDPAVFDADLDSQREARANYLVPLTYSGYDLSIAGRKTQWIFDTTKTIKINDEEIDFHDYDSDIPESPDDINTSPSDWTSDFKLNSDRIGDPELPSVDALSSGFIHAYYLTPAKSLQLAQWLLTDDFITNVKKLFANPIDYIMSVNMLPITPNGASANVIIGGVDSEISAIKIGKQYTKIDCGSIKIPLAWNGFPDFSAARISIYLPFIGYRELDVDDVMGASIRLMYYVDILTGACLAILDVDNTASKAKRKLNSDIYHFPGMMAMNTPITSADYSRKYQALFDGAGKVLSGTAAVAGGNVGDSGGIISGVAQMVSANFMKPSIDRAGALAGDPGMLGIYTPYVLIEYPTQALPKHYKALHGYMSCIGGTVGDFSGYLECESVELDVACTDAERDEILQLLEGGVFV